MFWRWLARFGCAGFWMWNLLLLVARLDGERRWRGILAALAFVGGATWFIGAWRWRASQEQSLSFGQWCRRHYRDVVDVLKGGK